MSDVEFVLKLRDASAMIQCACEDYLEKHVPKEEKHNWNPETIKWSQAQGTRGPYERYPGENQKAESTTDYHNLLKDLKDHDGKLSHKGYFYWVFTDMATIGRKPKTAVNS